MKLVIAVLCLSAVALASQGSAPVFSAEEVMLGKKVEGAKENLWWPWNYPESECIGELYYTPTVSWYGDLASYYWSDFNVLAFDSVTQDSTDVDTAGTKIGGRIAVGNNFRVKSTGSVGRQSQEPWLPYAAVVGNNLDFVTGNFEPDGRGVTCVLNPDECPQENLFVGGEATGDTPEYLRNRVRGSCGDFFKGNCLDLAFARAWVYYKTVSYTWAYHPSNTITQIRTEWNGKTVIITAAVPELDRYYITLDENTLAGANNFVLDGFNTDAEFVVTISGSSDITLSEGKWPGLGADYHVGRSVFNIPGERTVTIDNTRTPHILAPSATISQEQSRIEGFAIVNRISSLDTVYWVDCRTTKQAAAKENPRDSFPKFI